MGEWRRSHLETLPDTVAALVARLRSTKDEQMATARIL
jgi:hypothetical protein